MTATPKQLAHEKANVSVNAQIKVLTDLVKSLLKTMEERKEEHANQLETLTKTSTTRQLFTATVAPVMDYASNV